MSCTTLLTKSHFVNYHCDQVHISLCDLNFELALKDLLCLSVWLSVCQSVCPSVCLSVCPLERFCCVIAWQLCKMQSETAQLCSGDQNEGQVWTSGSSKGGKSRGRKKGKFYTHGLHSFWCSYRTLQLCSGVTTTPSVCVTYFKDTFTVCLETTVQVLQYSNCHCAHKLLFYQKGQSWLELETEICSLATFCSSVLLCYSHRHLIPAVAPASLSGSISAVHEAGWHPGMAPGCTVLHTPASAHPAHQTSNPPTITAWGRLSCALGGRWWWENSSYGSWCSMLDLLPELDNQICSLLLCDSDRILWQTLYPLIISSKNDAGTPKPIINEMHYSSDQR